MRVLLSLFLILNSLSLRADEVCTPQLKELAAKLELEFLKKEECSTSKNSAGEDVESCSDLLTVEDKIRRLEGEVAILRGFEKLIDDIQAQKDKLAEVNPREAKEVAKDLNEGLKTAYLMEELVSEDNPEDFITKLSSAVKSKAPEEVARPAVFKNTLREVCSTYSGEAKPDFCGEIDGISDSDIIEIGELIKQSPGAEQIADWREALAITTPDGSPYSFAAMHNILRDGGLDLSAEEINLTQTQIGLLRNLPQIQNKANLAYLDKIKKAKDQLEMTKIFGEMKYLTTELQNRQKFETQSSLSILWSELKKGDLSLTEEQSTACDEAYKDEESANLCLAAFKEKASTLNPSAAGKQRLLAFLDNVETSGPHLEKLAEFQAQCLKLEVLNNAQKTGKLPEGCQNKFPPQALQSKLDEIQKLTDQKNTIIAKNRDLFDLRNIAMDQIKDCQKTTSTVGEFCSLELGIDHEVSFLSLESQKLSLHFKEVSTLKAIDEICLEGVKQDSPAKAEACRILNPDPVAESEEPPPKKEEPKPIEDDTDYTPRNTMVRDAWVQGGINIAATIGQGLMQRPYNPYANFGGYQGPYYYSPGYNYGMGSTSDNLLMFNSAYFGSMSYYQSAPGYVPYSAYPIQGSYAHSLSQFFSPYTPLR